MAAAVRQEQPCSQHGELQPTCHIVTPVGMLGYGLDSSSTAAALASLASTNVPTTLILDSGSTDSGPHRLATGNLGVPRSSYVRDLRKLLDLRKNFRVPLIVSSAGGDGSDDHVRELLEIIRELSAERNGESKLKVITIFAEIDKELVSERLRSGEISGCGATVPPLTHNDIDNSPRIVAQMGSEPILQAMRRDPDFDVLIAGRAYDPSPYVAYAAFTSSSSDESSLVGGASKPDLAASLRWGGFTHMGKIMECGGSCAEPKGPGAMATVYGDGSFDVMPLDAGARCTSVSVAAHALYENGRPDKLYGPGGCLELTRSTYTQLADDRTVRVWGGEFLSSRELNEPYRVKLEAGKITGYRSMYIGSLKDPILIGQIESFLERVQGYVKEQHAGVPGSWELGFHTYGARTGPDPEVLLVGEAFASTEELATSVASIARIATIHGPYPGQKATSGNFAHGIGGSTVIPLGACSQFSIYHLMNLANGEEGTIGCDENGLKEPKQMKINMSPNTGTGGCSLRSGKLAIPLFGQRVLIIGDETPKGQTESRPSGKREVKANEPETCMLLPPNPTLGDVAKVIRSKNSGPFEITFDIMFEREMVYESVKHSGLLDKNAIANMYNIKPEEVLWCGFFDQARAFKATIPRRRGGKNVSAGGFLESDIHGSQQYMPLMKMALPSCLVENLALTME